MTSFNELLETIESPEFAALVGAANGPGQLLSFFSRSDPSRNLARLVADGDEEVIYALRRRIIELSGVPPEQGYYHPHDVALSAYLFALNAEHGRVFDSASAHARSAVRTWWTVWVSDLLERGARNTAATSLVANLLGESKNMGAATFSAEAHSTASESFDAPIRVGHSREVRDRTVHSGGPPIIRWGSSSRD